MTLELNGLSIPADLADVMERLARVGADLARMIARNGIEGDLAASAGVNSDGDGQKALDVIADEAFMAALKDSAVTHYASEEQEEVVSFGPGRLALAIDPLDGSSNIDVNVSIGTIFSIFPAADTPEASFLRPGTEQIAAGYIIYGPKCALVASFGAGVHEWVLDPVTQTFRRIADPKPLPAETSEYAINASNYRHWPAPVRAFIDDMVAGAEGPRGRNFNMRWVASLVAETHRILTRGGVFLYPSDDRKGYERGRLRHVYECAPIAFLITQAGGGATDGSDPILTALPDRLHARTPFIFGTAAKVARVAAYHDLPEDEASALFSSRGLFRS
ncbi:class 1 fructose-bisphosphatase [Paenirhodobacter sp. CAU 1674]|uniref:class 1 fructose-bisphosphatase n=1 Tax=Paenirhodobacter sp. CAU 1674 TaxID=3032596 RepID=UPI0023DC2B32|nr:class 1 fructose-bisphosphatase [Paenirhodobacter sp. CAU 1674]MDF2142541.1 class 1 fructose-bisphosphatase [Paenirhodobacter sp. CAU 1674]